MSVRSSWSRVCLALSVLLLAVGPLPAEAIKGITISTHGIGRDWGDDQIVPTLRELRQLGTNWVQIHPYASIRGDGSVNFRPLDPQNPPEHIVRPIREAHALGMKILIKPHLAYWGSPFEWRGAIEFEDEAATRRFFRDYERWIVALAAISREADGFAVGTELDRMLHREADWRRIIAGVREVTDTPLTYAANWDGYDHVPFWDAVDVIGIQAYFPLQEEGPVSRESVRAGWSRWMTKLNAFSRAQDRPIVFTELGYTHSRRAPMQPWSADSDDESSRWVQTLCTEEALAAVAAEETVIGAFLWKWFPQPHQLGRNFQLAAPEVRRVIRDAWVAAPQGSPR